MLIDIINLFIYNHELRNYFNGKILTMRRYIGNAFPTRAVVQTIQN